MTRTVVNVLAVFGSLAVAAGLAVAWLLHGLNRPGTWSTR